MLWCTYPSFNEVVYMHNNLLTLKQIAPLGSTSSDEFDPT